jgi:beta-N-acetylhexosaminidase
MSILLNAAVVLAALALAADDKADVEPAKKAPPKADVRGEITSLTPSRVRGTLGSIRVEGAKEKDTEHDKAVVRLPSTAKFFKWDNGKKVEAKFADLKVGSKVQCVFTGPVAESYPVQATGSEVIILEAPKKK